MLNLQCIYNVFSIRLYNKDAIIEYLLDKSAERPNTEVVAHIRGIKVPALLMNCSLCSSRVIQYGVNIFNAFEKLT